MKYRVMAHHHPQHWNTHTAYVHTYTQKVSLSLDTHTVGTTDTLVDNRYEGWIYDIHTSDIRCQTDHLSVVWTVLTCLTDRQHRKSVLSDKWGEWQEIHKISIKGYDREKEGKGCCSVYCCFTSTRRRMRVCTHWCKTPSLLLLLVVVGVSSPRS